MVGWSVVLLRPYCCMYVKHEATASTTLVVVPACIYICSKGGGPAHKTLKVTPRSSRHREDGQLQTAVLWEYYNSLWRWGLLPWNLFLPQEDKSHRYDHNRNTCLNPYFTVVWYNTTYHQYSCFSSMNSTYHMVSERGSAWADQSTITFARCVARTRWSSESRVGHKRIVTAGTFLCEHDISGSMVSRI